MYAKAFESLNLGHNQRATSAIYSKEYVSSTHSNQAKIMIIILSEAAELSNRTGK